MNPDLLQAALETVQAMRDLAKDKRRSAEVRIQAADTLCGILHSIGDIQHNVNDRIMADHIDDSYDGHDHSENSWR